MDERVERARRYVDMETMSTVEGTENMLAELLVAYDDLAARRDRDIREAVEVERWEMQNEVVAEQKGSDDDPWNDGWDSALAAVEQLIEQRGPTFDPATIRREERERAIEDCVEVAARRFEQYMDNIEKYNLWAVTDVINDVIVNPLHSLSDSQESKEAGS